MSGIKPPADAPPARLFRSLLRLPRPIERIAFRFEAASSTALYVRALTALELADAHEQSDPALARTAAALCTSRGEPLVEADDLGNLTQTEADSLVGEVTTTLARISPSFAFIDAGEWERVLRVGAADPTNFRTTVIMGGCLEAVGTRIYSAPEKFFGVPRGALLDGHWLAFRAAQAVYEQRRPKG